MKKVGIVLRGKHNNDGIWGPIDWKKSYHSLKKNIIDELKGYEIDIYYQTYNSPEISELKIVYCPKKEVITDINDPNGYQSNNMVSILSKVENPSDYEFIISTRFDILYKKPYSKWNIDKEKISIPFYQPNNSMNDCVHVIPYNLLSTFIDSLKRCKNNLHGLPINRQLIHSMEKAKFYSDTDYPQFFPLNNNPFYILHRKRRWGFTNEEQARNEAKRQGFIK